MRLNKCPCCKRKLLKQGLKNHIIGTAKNECWDEKYNELKRTPHLNFYWKHAQRFKKRRQSLSFIVIK